MKHVAPARWADLAEGRVPEAEANRLREHAEACARCGGERDRVAAARQALHKVRDGSSPSLSWDLLGARLYWSVSSERRLKERERASRRGVLRRLVPWASALAIAASGVAAVFLAAGKRVPSTVASQPAAAPVVPAPVPPPPIAPPVDSAITFLQGDVSVAGRSADVAAATTLRAGDVVATRAGRVGLQFGDRSGVLVEPDSSVELAAFDDERIVLKVTGAVTVELEKRRPTQRFTVVAGRRTVEVRGTVFRVAHKDGDFEVAVTRGKVAVSDGAGQVEVPAPMRLALPPAAPVLNDAQLQATTQKLAEEMRVPLLPMWEGNHGIRDNSAMMSVIVPAKSRVRVDGQPVATGSFALRTLPGQHLVEAGGYKRWVPVQSGAAVSTTFDEPSRTSERPAQVDAQVRANKRSVLGCAEIARKANPGASGSLRVEVGVNTDGSVDFVNLVQASADSDVDSCLVNLIRDRFTFPAGSRATVQKVLQY